MRVCVSVSVFVSVCLRSDKALPERVAGAEWQGDDFDVIGVVENTVADRSEVWRAHKQIQISARKTSVSEERRQRRWVLCVLTHDQRDDLSAVCKDAMNITNT